MYSSRFDKTQALLVARLRAGPDDAKDFPEHIERMLSAHREGTNSGKRLGILVLIDKGHSIPGPSIRKRVAEITSEPSFNPYLVVATENPLFRGVLSAISWAQRRKFQITVVKTPAEGVASIEEARGESLAALSQLVTEISGDK